MSYDWPKCLDLLPAKARDSMKSCSVSESDKSSLSFEKRLPWKVLWWQLAARQMRFSYISALAAGWFSFAKLGCFLFQSRLSTCDSFSSLVFYFFLCSFLLQRICFKCLWLSAFLRGMFLVIFSRWLAAKRSESQASPYGLDSHVSTQPLQ